MKQIKLLVVEDRDIIRDILKLYLSSIPDIKIMGEASDGKEAIDLVKKNKYDVVLMDINMPNIDGIEASKKMLALKPDIKILATSFEINLYKIRDLINLGVHGFILKGEDKNVYVEAIKMVHNGEIYLSEEVRQKTNSNITDFLNDVR